MKNTIFILSLLTVISIQAQSSKAKLQNASKGIYKQLAKRYSSDKGIYFVKEDKANAQIILSSWVMEPESEGSDYELPTEILRFFQNKNGKLIKRHTFTFHAKDLADGIEFVDSIELVKINKKPYYLFKMQEVSHGTAYGGFNTMDYIFYNIKKNEISVIHNEYWNKNPDNISVRNSKITKNISRINHKTKSTYSNDLPKKSKYKELIAYLKKHKIKKRDLDIEKEENFHLKWLSLNKGIYKTIEETNKWHKVNFAVYPQELMFTEIKNGDGLNLTTNYDFIAKAGFVNPVLAYSHQKKETYVVWIPYGYPNGGGWGIRSFQVLSISKEGILKTKKDETIIEFDLINQRVRVLEEKNQ